MFNIFDESFGGSERENFPLCHCSECKKCVSLQGVRPATPKVFEALELFTQGDSPLNQNLLKREERKRTAASELETAERNH